MRQSGYNNNTDVPDYFMSNINKAADKRMSEVLTNKKYIMSSVLIFKYKLF